MKRFYKDVTIAPVVGLAKTEQEFQILLDGKPMKTPAKENLILPNEAMAQLIADEWQAVEKDSEIDPAKMYHTQVAVTAQDYVSKNRTDIEQVIMRYLDTELMCYHTPEPPEMAKHQAEHWTPHLRWFEKEMGITLPVKQGLDVHRPSDEDYKIIVDFMETLDMYRFALFQMLVSMTGSIILASAFVKSALSAEEIFKLVKLEELFYIDFHDLEQHGPDPIQDKSFTQLKAELAACESCLKTL
jgi:chaperone required for assembly of F1-ATPase